MGKADLSDLDSSVEVGFSALFALVESGDELAFVLRRGDEYFWAVQREKESVDGVDVELSIRSGKRRERYGSTRAGLGR